MKERSEFPPDGEERDAPTEPLCTTSVAGHCPHWYDSGEACHYCDTPGHCDHTADVTYDGRWCGICNPWFGGDSNAQE